jgi:DNA-binding MarR family transcriptional regulator
MSVSQHPHATTPEPGPEVYRVAAELRAALRAFNRRSEQAAREQGLTPQQYQLLLLIKGSPDGLERATVTDLAQRLQLGQSTVTELVQRAVDAGLVQRSRSPQDARVGWLTLTPDGSRRLREAIVRLGPERRQLASVLASLKLADDDT